MNRPSQRGLTLPELLIALLIFAMISGAAVHALRLSVEGREQLEIADSQIREVQIMRQIVKQDLANVVARIVRDDFGNPYPAAFLGGKGISFRAPIDGERTLLVFVRRGWTNPDDRAPRSTLQAVEYLIKGDNLVRRVRPYLDDARGQKRNDRILLTKVTDAGIGFFSGAETTSGPEFVDLWPAPSTDVAIPQAIRLTLTTERFGAVEQLFWLGSAN